MGDEPTLTSPSVGGVAATVNERATCDERPRKTRCEHCLDGEAARPISPSIGWGWSRGVSSTEGER